MSVSLKDNQNFQLSKKINITKIILGISFCFLCYCIFFRGGKGRLSNVGSDSVMSEPNYSTFVKEMIEIDPIYLQKNCGIFNSSSNQ